jgi:hypothetical protein
MEVVRTSETSIYIETTWRQILERSQLHLSPPVYEYYSMFITGTHVQNLFQQHEIWNRKFSINNIQEFYPYLTENTFHHHKDQMVYAVLGNNHCLQWEPYETHKYKMRSYWLLKHVEHSLLLPLG